jgi:hypothetical protein
LKVRFLPRSPFKGVVVVAVAKSSETPTPAPWLALQSAIARAAVPPLYAGPARIAPRFGWLPESGLSSSAQLCAAAGERDSSESAYDGERRAGEHREAVRRELACVRLELSLAGRAGSGKEALVAKERALREGLKKANAALRRATRSARRAVAR